MGNKKREREKNKLLCCVVCGNPCQCMYQRTTKLMLSIMNNNNKQIHDDDDDDYSTQKKNIVVEREREKAH